MTAFYIGMAVVAALSLVCWAIEGVGYHFGRGLRRAFEEEKRK